MRDNIAVATDSACDLPQALCDQYKIPIIPLRIRFQEKEYRDRFEIDSDTIYNTLTKEIPRSSMPSIEDITRTWDALADRCV